jgi:hypothetical protein
MFSGFILLVAEHKLLPALVFQWEIVFTVCFGNRKILIWKREIPGINVVPTTDPLKATNPKAAIPTD